ncbi:polysaccharide biosynthesis tyrosine autokinase [Microbacterium pseudoresistens]|uniref:Capsular exopolysaccharide synthesis family protein n=1 Tax=Microbacterium pseudoresistens TaxID=640634 RepID=A0A7Y9JMQ0_9MICO|nr:polysaccharide biosynthesis tyrosine autokinase [Microbacterium pseudoresistens]NYD54580.1 capsular exopolysaccharide synthesis family protein [Microbacterium pseudoresistens]
MDLHDYLRVLRRNLVLILSCTIIGLSAGLLLASLTPPRYQSSAELYVAAETSQTSSSELNLGRSYAQQAVTSYLTLFSSELVLQPVIDDLGLDTTPAELASRVDASAPPNSVSITVSVTARTPSQAARVTAAVADSFRSAVTETIERGSANRPSPIRIDIVQPAQVPISPVAPKPVLSTVLGALIGLAVGVGAAVLRSVIDTRVHGMRDVERATEAPVLGAVPFSATASAHPLVVTTAPHSPPAEAHRALRTNLQFFSVEGKPIVLTVTSAGPGEGKTTTAVNLAIAVAETGAKVALVDGDLRLPRVADRLGIEGGIGLSDVLAGRLTASQAIQRWGRGTLFVLPSGTRPPNPAELLGSSAMTRLIDDLTSVFDVVIVDAPPLLLVTDAAVLAKTSTGALLAVAAGKTTVPRLASAVESIDKVGAHVLGTVLTMVPTTGADRTAYGAYAKAEA